MRALSIAATGMMAQQTNVEVIANDLRPGALVVTLGNYELRQGMAVETEKSR